MQNSSATKLLHAILAKTGLELTLIIVAISLAAYAHFNPPIRGAIDIAGSTRIAGWAYDPREPETELEVQLFLDGKFAATGRADASRPDLISAGAAKNANHGFAFDVTSLHLTPGKYQIDIYALRSGSGKNKALLSLTKKDYFLEIP